MTSAAIRTPALRDDYLGRVVHFLSGPYRLISIYGIVRGVRTEAMGLWLPVDVVTAAVRQ
jgi:hypothetical protein